jgi:radical SAM superfamily enzyme YgiQ (UPF0313 family)
MMSLKTEKGSILLVSCYELGHPPAGIASPAGFLHRAGYEVESLDVSVEGFDAAKAARARVVGISVPMHTALRLGVRVAREIRRLNPNAHICFYGMYASLNADYLLDTIADSVVGGEAEGSLVALIESIDAGRSIEIEGLSTRGRKSPPVLRRLDFAVPDRNTLPSLERYARLDSRGEQKLAGYVEASRGCLHHCAHCPIPPVYGGRFFAVPKEVVLEDIRRQALGGARHITFGDPDFLNGPAHAQRIARALREEFDGLTFDFTAKIEHLLKHRDLLAEFAASGCLFVVSAVESLSDEVLRRLDKGHTRKDVEDALRLVRGARLTLRPSFVAFTPWTTLDDYIELLDFVEANDLVDHVDPVQYSIRLLVPPGSVLLSQPDAQSWVGPLNQESFTYEWTHPDARMDELQKGVAREIEFAARRDEDGAETFYRVRRMAYAMRGREQPLAGKDFSPLRLRPPRLTEAWFC